VAIRRSKNGKSQLWRLDQFLFLCGPQETGREIGWLEIGEDY
jgi:hypothetical protein